MVTETAIVWLGASVMFTLSVHLRSVGLAKPADRVVFGALGMLLASAAVHSARNTPWRVFMLVAIWGLPALLCVHAARAAALAGSSPSDDRLGKRIRMVGAALWAGAALNVILLPISLASDSQWLPLLAIVGALIVAGCYTAWGLGQRHAERGHGSLAAVARALFLWGAASLVLPVLTMLGLAEGPATLIAVLGLPILTPLLTRALVGAGPVPLDLVGDFEQPDTKTQLAVLLLLCTVSLGLLLLEYGKHFGRCGGVLEPATAPADWRELPASSQSHDGKVGRFHLHATRLDYKGYPAEYENAALGDPALCFASTISLAKWFDGDMYRSPSELRLRHSVASGIFIVSAGDESQPEQLLTAFRRVESPRLAFDSTLSRGFVAAGSLLFGLGTACGALWYRLRLRRASERWVRSARFTAITALIASSCSSPLLEQRWESNRTPKPGRELAVHYPWLM